MATGSICRMTYIIIRGKIWTREWNRSDYASDEQHW